MGFLLLGGNREANEKKKEVCRVAVAMLEFMAVTVCSKWITKP